MAFATSSKLSSLSRLFLIYVVAGEKVEGKITRMNDKQITIDGKKYDVASNATVSDNEDEDI